MTCIQYKQFKQHYKIVNKIGNGNCASVIKIQDVRSRQVFALKCAKIDTPQKLAICFQQIQVIRAINHPGAINIYHYFVKNSNPQSMITGVIQFGMIMELGDRSLEQDIFMRKKKQKYYKLEQLEQIMGILVGFFTGLEKKGYLHRDIKPDNILIMGDEGTKVGRYQKYKVCDFGFAIKLHQFSDKNIAGTASYASPKIQNKFKNTEIFINGNNYKDDVYSLGITFIQLCTLRAVEELILNKTLQAIGNRYGFQFMEIIQWMVQGQEEKRPDFIQLEHICTRYLMTRQNCGNNISMNNGQNTVMIQNITTAIKQKNPIHELKQKHDNNRQYLQNYSPLTNQSSNCSNYTKQYTTPNNKIIHNNIIQQTNSIESYKKLYIKQKQQVKNKQNDENEKQKKNLLKPTQQKYKYQYIGNDQLQNNCIKNKIKTKRRSKTIHNQNQYTYKQFIKDHKNSFYLYKFGKNYKNGIYQHFDSIQNGKQTSILPIAKYQTDKGYQQLKILYKFQQCSNIKFISIIQFDQQSVDIQQRFSKIVISVIAKNNVYLLCQDLLYHCKFIAQILLQKTLENPKFLLFCQKLKRLVIACNNGLILTFNVQNFLQIASSKGKNISKKTILNAKQLNLIEFKIQPNGLTAIHINQMTGDIVMGLKNGQVIMNNKSLFIIGKGKIDYVRKYHHFVYVASFQGVIRKYLYREHGGGQTTLLGYYDCNNTIIGIEVYESQSKPVTVVVVSTGFLLLLNQNLQLSKIRSISKDCLRTCTLNYEQSRGKRLFAMDSLGNIFNEYGHIISETKIQHSVLIYSIDKGNKIVVSDQMGTIYQIKPRYLEQEVEIGLDEGRNESVNGKIIEGKLKGNLKESDGKGEKTKNHLIL